MYTSESAARMKPQSLIAAMACLIATTVRADDFCIQSKVYLGSQTIQSTTIFRDGATYDFLDQPAEITIFDAPRSRFIVLDPTRKIRTEVTTAQIDEFVQKLKVEALARKVPLLAFLASPEFQESFDDKSGDLTLTSPWVVYRAKTTLPKASPAATQYAEFLNWQTKLNVVIQPGSLPPFPRLELNAALERHKRIPTAVESTRYAQNLARKPITLRAEHRIQWQLLDGDLARIQQAEDYRASLELVDLSAYLRK